MIISFAWRVVALVVGFVLTVDGLAAVDRDSRPVRPGSLVVTYQPYTGTYQ